jgi:hypothetical protein
VTADNLDRVQDHLQLGVHHADRGRRRIDEGAQQVLEALAVAEVGQADQGAVLQAERADPSQAGSPLSAACRAARLAA